MARGRAEGAGLCQMLTQLSLLAGTYGAVRSRLRRGREASCRSERSEEGRAAGSEDWGADMYVCAHTRRS